MKALSIALSIIAFVTVMVLPLAGQSRDEFVHHRYVRVEAPWGSERVLVMYPRLAGSREHPRDRRWSLLVALHGQGEARRGPERGFLGWALDYQLPSVFGVLATGRLAVRDFRGYVRPERLSFINAQLARSRWEGLMVVCPYTPDLMSEPSGSERILEWSRWIAGPMLEAVRAELPNAARNRASTGIDGVSLGGMLALEVGLRHPESFAAVGAMQPAVRGREESIAAIADANAEQRIRLLTSDDDPFREPTRTLSERLRERHIAHDLTIVPGPHDYSFNRGAGGIEMLFFHERTLARERVRDD